MLKLIKLCYLTLLLGGMVFSNAYAQEKPDPEYVYPPICFEITNTAPYTVFGEVSTAEDQNDQGKIVTHRAVFRLKNQESEPVCSTGPYYEGSRLRITLRTIFPIFECKTLIYEDADIIIRGQVQNDGTTETWIECL